MNVDMDFDEVEKVTNVLTSAKQLIQIIEKIGKLEEEKDDLAIAVRGVYSEAEGQGFDKKALRQVIKLRKMDRAERAELESIVETYMSAIGE